MKHLVLGALVAFSLGGCATKPLVVDCADFRSAYVRPVLKSPTIEAIQTDSREATPSPQPGKLFDDEQIKRVLASDLLSALQGPLPMGSEGTGGTVNLARGASGEPVVLLLSGGGQWGAFGSSYLRALSEKSPSALPKFTTVTGVSTGAIQALFVGANQAKPEGRFLKDLTIHYRPAHERDIVDRGSFVSALFKGSVAGLEPLRQRIEDALCPGGVTGPRKCPAIEALATDGAPIVMVGFVEASSGDMFYADITKIARTAVAGASIDAFKHGQQCIAGAVLASVAMPFYYQQVQVRSVEKGVPSDITYYDGGVRQSVFFAQEVQKAQMLAGMLARGELRTMGGAGLAVSAPADYVTIYAIRNGPTVAKPEPGIDDPSGAVPSALRGYSLLVNQSETASLEAMRLRRPDDRFFVATADRYVRAFDDPGLAEDGISAESHRPCEKQVKDAMFEPQFMRCLQAVGRSTAHDSRPDRTDGWISIP